MLRAWLVFAAVYNMIGSNDAIGKVTLGMDYRIGEYERVFNGNWIFYCNIIPDN